MLLLPYLSLRYLSYFEFLFMVNQRKRISIIKQSSSYKHIFYESDTKKSTIDSLHCILNILWVIDLSLILINTSFEIYSISKESSIELNFCQYIMKPNVFLYTIFSLRFMTYTQCYILGKLFLEKNAIKSRFVIAIISNLNIV